MVAQNRSKHIGIHSGLSNKLSTINLPMEILRHELADHGIDAELAYDIIHEHLMLDGNSRLNLATFVSTWMEPQARRLMDECADKNMIDKDEYPQTAEIEERCLKILMQPWVLPPPAQVKPACWLGWSCDGIGAKSEAPKAKIRIDLIL
jgi:glutamate decarboxylase